MSEKGLLVQRIEDERIAISAARIIKARNDMQQSGRVHRCSHTRCKPMDEEALIQMNKLQGPKVTSNVYVCQLGAVHICSDSTCEMFNATPDKICPISGIQHAQITSSYTRNDPKTWYENTAREPVQKKARKQNTDILPTLRKMQSHTLESIQFKASEYVKRLLFGVERVKLNNATIEERNDLVIKMCEKYRREQLSIRQLPYESELHKIRGSITSQPLPLCEFVFNDELLQYYTGVIVQEWNLIITYLKEDTRAIVIQKCDVETISVSTLYCMKDGISQDGMVMLPRDEFLKAHLPKIGDLERYFSIGRDRIQLGKKIITASIIHSVKKRGHASLGAREMITISSEQRDTFQRMKDISKVPVKLSTSGETLFMPQSRKKNQ